MTVTTDDASMGMAPDTGKTPVLPLVFIAGLFLVELIGIGTLFKHLVDFRCLDHWPLRVCRNASYALVAIYCLLGVTALLVMLRPSGPLRALVRSAGQRLWPIGLNLLGFAVALVPLSFLSGAEGTSMLLPSLAFWTVGMLLMLGGVASFIAPLHRWTSFVAAEWSALLPALVVALIAPSVSARLQPIWSIDWISTQTFSIVAWMIDALGYETYADPDKKIIGAGEFYIRIANVCSGIEGIALVTLFVTLYLWLFRKDLRFPLAFLLYPIGIATSAFFNIVRITVLLYIGLEGNPELAVGGFHSHAGWMMFTLVALGVIGLAQTVPALRKSDGAGPGVAQTPVVRFWDDPVVAKILPFAIFMLSAVVASTLSQNPSMIYPIRVVLMVAVLALVFPYFRRLPWRLDPVAVGVGAVIALYWVLIPVAPSDAVVPYGGLSGALLVLWFMARGIGTIFLVPVIEEAFFRGYLERRLRLSQGVLWKIGAAVLTGVLFAALHGRWAEAFVASLLFSWVAWRRDNLADAIVSHGVANALIFAAAVAMNDLAMI